MSDEEVTINSDEVYLPECEEGDELQEEIAFTEPQLIERNPRIIREAVCPQKQVEHLTGETVIFEGIKETDDTTVVDEATLKEENDVPETIKPQATADEKVKAQWIPGPILKEGYPTSFIGTDKRTYNIPLSEEDTQFLSTYGEGANSTETLQYLTYGITEKTRDIAIVLVNVNGNNYLMYTPAEEAKSFLNVEDAVTECDGQIKVRAKRIDAPIFDDGYPTSFLGPDNKLYTLPLREQQVKFLSKFGEGETSTEPLGYLTCGVTRDTKNIQIVFTTVNGNNYLMYTTAETAKHFIREEEEEVDSEVLETIKQNEHEIEELANQTEISLTVNTDDGVTVTANGI